MKSIKLTLLIAIFFAYNYSYGQSYIKLTNGERFWVEIDKQTDSIIFVDGDDLGEFQISKKNIAYIEYEERGLYYYNKEGIKDVNDQALKDLANKDSKLLLKEGNNVYIPFASNRVAGRAGGKKLRELMELNSLWNVVDNELEAHFIIHYYFDDNGVDNACLIFKTRDNRTIYITPSVKASDFIPFHAGQESAVKLYNKYLRSDSYDKFIQKMESTLYNN